MARQHKIKDLSSIEPYQEFQHGILDTGDGIFTEFVPWSNRKMRGDLRNPILV